MSLGNKGYNIKGSKFFLYAVTIHFPHCCEGCIHVSEADVLQGLYI